MRRFDADAARAYCYSALGRVLPSTRGQLKKIADPDDVQEAVALAWLESLSGRKTFVRCCQTACSMVRSYRAARSEASESYWREQYPTTIREAIRWVYSEDHIVFETSFPQIPMETTETRIRRFVRPADYDRLPSLTRKARHYGEDAERHDAEDDDNLTTGFSELPPVIRPNRRQPMVVRIHWLKMDDNFHTVAACVSSHRPQ